MENENGTLPVRKSYVRPQLIKRDKLAQVSGGDTVSLILIE